MKQLNVSISDEAYRIAKLAADQDGMLLRKWVERAIVEATAQPANSRQLVPLDDL